MQYHCPGESYAISRSVHLGRLATFYDKCRTCPHRTDTATLPTTLIEQLKESWQGELLGARFTAEGVEGVFRNQLTSRDVRELAYHFAAQAVDAGGDRTCEILLAGDDRPLTPELIVAAAEGLRRAGCRVIDVGTASAPALVWALGHERADGGMFIGNATDDPHHVGLKFWTAHAKPLSTGHGLERLQRSFILGGHRPTRSFGALTRLPIEANYLATLTDYFHALRPLRVILDTTCESVVRYLKQLTVSVACEVFDSRTEPSRFASPALPRSATRWQTLAERVRAAQAHFGLWIDGDGEACQLFDECGQLVTVEQLFAVLSRGLGLEPIVVGHDEPTRAATYDALVSAGASLGCNASGRLWFDALQPTADALRALATLLMVLSQSDRPLSIVVRESLESSALLG